MAGRFGEMASDLSKLLEEVKVKPIIVKEQAAEPMAQPEAPKTVDTRDLARQVVGEVFGKAPKGIRSDQVGLTLHYACDAVAVEHSLTRDEVFAAVMEYCIGAIETAQLHEDQTG